MHKYIPSSVMEKKMKVYLLALLVMLVIGIIFCSLYFNRSGNSDSIIHSSEMKTIKKINEKSKSLCCLNIVMKYQKFLFLLRWYKM